MQETQAAPNTRSHGQHFRSSVRIPGGVKDKQNWPVQSADKPQALVKRRTSLSNGPKKHPPASDAVIRRPTAVQHFFASFSLERSFTLIGFLVAASVISVFGCDLACGWPFRRASLLFDATSTTCGAVLALLCWDVFREQVKGFTR